MKFWRRSRISVSRSVRAQFSISWWYLSLVLSEAADEYGEGHESEVNDFEFEDYDLEDDDDAEEFEISEVS